MCGGVGVKNWALREEAKEKKGPICSCGGRSRERRPGSDGRTEGGGGRDSFGAAGFGRCGEFSFLQGSFCMHHISVGIRQSLAQMLQALEQLNFTEVSF